MLHLYATYRSECQNPNYEMIPSQSQLSHNIFWGVCEALKTLQMILDIILEKQQNLKLMSARLLRLSNRNTQGLSELLTF